MAGIDRRTDERHTPDTPLEISVSALGRRKFLKRRGSSVTATVLEVSAGGMLLDLPLEIEVDPGDAVALSSGGGRDAEARVVHTVRDENWTSQWAGVELTEMSPGFTESHNLLITSLGLDHVLNPR